VATAETPTPAEASEGTEPKTGELRPLSATLYLVSGTKLEGTLLSATELTMKTSFGEASIPLNEVAGIRLAEAGNGTTTVILHNGDSITGGTELEKLDIVTEWGQAEVNGANISSILFTQGLKWETATGFSGSRWTLIESATTTSTAKPTNNASPASANSASTTRVRSSTGNFPTFGTR
jgi:hypothetical protein